MRKDERMKEFFIKHFRYYLISVLLMTVFVIFMKVTNMELSIGAIEIGIIVGSIGLTTKLQKEGNLESIKDFEGEKIEITSNLKEIIEYINNNKTKEPTYPQR